MNTHLLKKEIAFRARRGMKEIDLALARYLSLRLEGLTAEELQELCLFLKNTLDQDLMLWLFEDHTPPTQHKALVEHIKTALVHPCAQ